jgi:hypothetical protein
MSCTNSCLLDFDNAPCIPVNAFTDTSIEFNVFYEEPVDLSTGTFSFTLSTDERGDCPVLTIAEGDGLTVASDTQVINEGEADEETLSGYRITLLIPKDHSLRFGDYYGQVRHDAKGRVLF